MAWFSRSILLSVLVILGCDSYLDVVYTPSTRDYLVSVIKGSQDGTSGLFEKSLTTSYYATEALSASGVGVPNQDALCSSLDATKFSSWEELYHLMETKSRIPNCLRSITDSTRQKLTDGLRGNKMSKIYYAVASIHSLVSTEASLFDTASLDLLAIAKHIESFRLPSRLFTETVKSSKSKGSIHKTSMALSAVAKLVSLPNLTDAQRAALQSDAMRAVLASMVETATVLVADHSPIGSEMVSYSNSLTATAVVLEAINEFIATALRLLDDAHFDKFADADFIESLYRYILSFRSTTSPTSARHVLALMDLLKTSPLMADAVPLYVKWKNMVFHDEPTPDEPPLTLTVSDVFGEAILSRSATADVVSSKKGPKGSMTGSDGKTFSFSFGAAVRGLNLDDGAHGVYRVKASLSDDATPALAVTPPVASVKVTTSLSSAVLGVQYSKKSDEGFSRVSWPGALDQVFDASPSQKVKLEIHAKAPQKPSQIVVAFIDEGGRSVLQIPPKTRQEKYVLTIDLNKNAFSALKEGRYSVDVIIGDALFRGTTVWRGVVAVECIEEEEEAEVDYEPINDEVPKWEPQPEIQHTFGRPESTPPVVFPVVFCGVVAAPLLYFVYAVFVRMALVIRMEENSPVSSMLFLVSLGAVAGILFFYWRRWNIFEAGGRLAMAAVPLFFFGYNVLKQHLLRRTGTKTKGKKA